MEILGFTGVPEAGDPFQATESEKFARQIGDKRQELKKVEEARNVKKITLDDSMQNEGVLLISIEYIVSSTNSRFNFVFPYYSEEETEINILTTNHPLAT